MALTNQRFQIKSYPTPLPIDLIFYEEIESRAPEHQHQQWAYGQPHWDPVRYPDHELVLVKASRKGDGKQEWYYAARRESQNSYNYEVFEGTQLIRTYIFKRNEYVDRRSDDGAGGVLPCPPAGASSPDALFPHYCFADDTVRRGEPELDSLYVVVQRRYLEPVKTDHIWDNDLQSEVIITKTIIPSGTGVAAAGDVPGYEIEIQHGNYYHDIEIIKEASNIATRQIGPLGGFPSLYDRRFPPLLVGIDAIWAYAWARSDTHAPSYTDDYYFDYKITEPRPGPYSSVIERWITSTPSSVAALNPILIMPQPISESVGLVGWWFNASSIFGNQTYAIAKEINIPSTIHGPITINFGSEVEPTDLVGTLTFLRKATLDATPNYLTLVNAGTEEILDYSVRPLPMGMYEVSVIKVNISNLYS